MKPILYRAKAINRNPNMNYRTDYQNGDWVYGLVSKLYKYDDKYFAEMTNTDGVSGIDVDPETICEYTGLTDKNGNKIFDDDIVQFEDDTPGQYEYHDDTFMNVGVVEYNNGRFYFTNRVSVEMDDIIYENIADCTVIGNIYDNPELLEK